MPHIHTNPGQHDLTVSAYILRLDRPEPTILLHRHKKLKVYMQFGGHVELDENPWQAIEHELLEESGYSFKQLKLLQPKQRMKSLSDATLHPQPVLLLTHTFDDIKHSHTDISYAFTTHESPKGVIGSSESTMLKEYTAAELRTVPAADILENAREESLYILEELLNTWVEVPAV